MALSAASTTATTIASTGQPKQGLRFKVRKLAKEDGDGSIIWTGNEQGATDCDEWDTSCSYRKNIKFLGGFPVEYSCEEELGEVFELDSATESNFGLFDTLVTFEYEATLPNTLDSEEVRANISALEWSILMSTAREIGLKPQCNFGKQYSSRRQLAEAAGLPYPLTIYKINRTPSDVHDPDDSCKGLVYDTGKYQCIVITATTRVYYRGMNENLLVDKFYFDTAQHLMQRTPNKLRAGEVQALHWIGIRPAETSGPAGTDLVVNDTVQSGGERDNAATMGTIISVSTIFLLGVIFFAFRGRKRKEVDEEVSSGRKAPEDLVDIEGGSATSDASTGLRKSSSGDMYENSKGFESRDNAKTLMADTMEVSSTMATVGDPTKDGNVDQSIPGANSHDSTEAPVKEGAAGVPPLPPRPPSRRNSTNLKKKRKKRKKKKKKTVLKRVNSRENIQEMETIKESEDEESEFGSECDSEYTETDDECSSNGSSSGGNLTPVRTRSFGSRGGNSPKLSPQNELFSADVFTSGTDFDFVIEAPDFPFEKYVKNDFSPSNEELQQMQNGTNKPNDDSVPPIQEEKIKPIPPPWV